MPYQIWATSRLRTHLSSGRPACLMSVLSRKAWARELTRQTALLPRHCTPRIFDLTRAPGPDGVPLTCRELGTRYLIGHRWHRQTQHSSPHAPSGCAGSRGGEAAAAQEPLSRPAWWTAGWTPSTSAERHSVKFMAVGRRPCHERPANEGRYDVQRPDRTLPHRGRPCGSSQSLSYRCFNASLS